MTVFLWVAIIGKLYIQKVLTESICDSNKIEITSKIGNSEAFINQAIYGVRFYYSDYAQCPDFIEINNVNFPSKNEIYKILRYTLGSTSLYSFAAEIQAHAIFTYYADHNIAIIKDKICQYIINKEYKLFPQNYRYLIALCASKEIDELIIKHGIKADVSYGEETFSAVTMYIYLEDDAYFTLKQKEEHSSMFHKYTYPDNLTEI